MAAKPTGAAGSFAVAVAVAVRYRTLHYASAMLGPSVRGRFAACVAKIGGSA